MDLLKDSLLEMYEAEPHIGNLIFLDVETTGLEKTAKLIEIGAIGVSFDGVECKLETFEALINPGFPITEKITEITKITQSMLDEHGGTDNKYTEFVEWVKKINPKHFVAHNAKFDASKLYYNLDRVGFSPIKDLPTWDWICTLEMSRRLLKDAKANNLGALSEYFKFANRAAHRALADTEVCGYVFSKLRLMQNAKK